MSGVDSLRGGIEQRFASFPFFVALAVCFRAAPFATAVMLLVELFFGVVPLALYVTVSLFAGDVAQDPRAVPLQLWVPLIAALLFLLQISEVGTHTELLAADGVYRELYSTQAAAYR